MQDTRKKDFTLRISQANRTELTVIVYEMALAYLEEARETEDQDGYELAICRARACIDQLKHSLDFKYELAGMLLHLYIHINKLLVRAAVSGKHKYLDQASAVLERLRDSFVKVAAQDRSGPMIENAETVYAGYTYGRTDVNLNLDSKSTGRGFLV